LRPRAPTARAPSIGAGRSRRCRSTNEAVLLAPAFVRFGADHVLREPLEHVQAEGFSIEVLERSKLGLVERLLARKPGPG
jgi:hypothetical protein